MNSFCSDIQLIACCSIEVIFGSDTELIFCHGVQFIFVVTLNYFFGDVEFFCTSHNTPGIFSTSHNAIFRWKIVCHNHTSLPKTCLG